MARHKRTCKVIRVTHKLCSEIEELREENIALKARLEEARGAKPNVNVQMQNNVIFNVYGQEDSLANEQVGSILCSLLPIESVPKYIKMKHFSKPENANIHIKNKRGRTIQVVEEDENKRRRWEVG